MNEKRFNLLDQPWIRVQDQNGCSQELSMKEVFLRAHTLTSLSGELPTQDAAILRLLLAVLYAVFTRVDKEGKDAPLGDAEEALRRWNALWQCGQFPMEVIEEYLEYYRERFYLFHPETPFFQVTGLRTSNGKFNSVTQMLTDVPSRRERMFITPRFGDAAYQLDFNEAARWLINLHAWDYAGKKASVEGGSPNGGGTGWLGKLGLVYPEGNTLFETLMLNFVLMSGDALLDFGVPVWEEETSDAAKCERYPEGYCSLLTWQSRRVLLQAVNDKIDGVIYSYGDVFPKENTFIEQMSGWHRSTEVGHQDDFIPNLHKVSRSLWRDLPAILPLNAESKGQLIPGVVQWLALLSDSHIGMIRLHAVGIDFGAMQAIVNEMVNDTLSLNARLMTELGKQWNVYIAALLGKTEQCVKQLGFLASDLSEASGDRRDSKGKMSLTMKGLSDVAQEEAYFSLDLPFCSWLSSIDPQTGNMDQEIKKWLEILKRTVFTIGEKLVKEAGEKAFVGHMKKNESNDKNAPVAYMRFRSQINRIIEG